MIEQKPIGHDVSVVVEFQLWAKVSGYLFNDIPIKKRTYTLHDRDLVIKLFLESYPQHQAYYKALVYFFKDTHIYKEATTKKNSPKNILKESS